MRVTSTIWFILPCVFILHIAGLIYILYNTPKTFGTQSARTASLSFNLAETLIIEDIKPSDERRLAARNKPVDETLGGKENSINTPSSQRSLKKAPTVSHQNTKPNTTAPKPSLVKTKNEANKKPKRKTQTKRSSVKKSVAKKPITKRAVKKKATRQTTKRTRKKATKNSRKGGVFARSKAAQKSQSGKITQSKGQSRAYRALVQSWIARHKPRNIAGRGTAKVAFGLDREGRLRYARLYQSSGSRQLDQAALSAVRRAAPFPKPPKGLSLKQLEWGFPFRFQ